MFKNAVYSNGPSNASVALDEEEITKKIHDSYKRKAYSFTDSIFGATSDRVTYPFASPNSENLDQALIHSSEEYRKVNSFLNEHEFIIVDFVAGLCRKAGDNRKHKIGKILARNSADPTMIQLFNNSPLRSASKTSTTKLCITVSRNIVDVAMMSTNRGWRSCMNLFTGGYSSRVYRDLAAGTHIAYLHRSDDMDIKNPICRILLKPFKRTSCFWTAKILVPEPRVYGTDIEGFKEFVHEWARTLFKRTYFDKSFTRLEGLYNDGAGDVFVPIDFENSSLPYVEGKEEEKTTALQNHVPEEFAIKFLHDKNSTVRYRAIRRCNSIENIRKFIDDEYSAIAEVVAGKITCVEDANYLIDKWIGRDSDVVGRIFSNKRLDETFKIGIFERKNCPNHMFRYIGSLTHENMVKINPTNPAIAWTIACNVRINGRDGNEEVDLEFLNNLSSNKYRHIYLTRWAMSPKVELRKFCAERGTLLVKLLAYANSYYYDQYESCQYIGKMIPEYITKYLGDLSKHGDGNNKLWSWLGTLEAMANNYSEQSYIFDENLERYVDLRSIHRRFPEKEVVIDLETGLEAFGPWLTNEDMKQRREEAERRIRREMGAASVEAQFREFRHMMHAEPENIDLAELEQLLQDNIFGA